MPAARFPASARTRIERTPAARRRLTRFARPGLACYSWRRKNGDAKEQVMKLCRYDDDRLGVVRGDLVHDITEAQTEIRKSAPYAMTGDAVVAALPAWRERMEKLADKAAGKPISRVKLLPPVARPSKLSCAPTNYQAHIEEMRKASAQPGSQVVAHQSSKILEAGMFLKANSALVGPSEGIPLRFPDRRNDHEVELVMVIGKAGSDIPQAKALDHVAGYCLGLDMTVRGREDRSFRKSVDGYAVLGPWMVTADEIPDPDAVPISLTVNGEVRQNSNTSQLIYNCRRLIEFASAFYTLYPGDLVYTGTPEGVNPVKPGDVIVCRSAPVLGELTIAVRAHEAGAIDGAQRAMAQA
jgi:2,4-didehydro-3-deoxy-L-rhamnonate hydrolase